MKTMIKKTLKLIGAVLTSLNKSLNNINRLINKFNNDFLFKIIYPQDVDTIIDDKNKFICINLTLINKDNKFIICWKDSYRIFSVSLDKLCLSLKIEGKTSKYLSKYNNIDLFKDPELLEEFKKYSLQDSICLLKALNILQDMYNQEYGICITTIISTSTLSLKIFRKWFLDKKIEIPIIRGWIDQFIRKGYFGGATDYYKAEGYNLHYYDVNSLYPHVMCNSMPLEMIEHHKDLTNYELKNFFGFCLAEIYCPQDIKIPLLPFKYKGKTIYPTGRWIGIYFSEELKEVIKYGYKIRLINGYEFSKADLFSDYVYHFYDKKRNATMSKDDTSKFIAKMQLNQLYGIFGRKQELIQTINVKNEDIINYITTRIVKSIIKINDETSTLLISKNINIKILKQLNTYF